MSHNPTSLHSLFQGRLCKGSVGAFHGILPQVANIDDRFATVLICRCSLLCNNISIATHTHDSTAPSLLWYDFINSAQQRTAFCLSGTRLGRGRCKEVREPDELSPLGGRRVCSWWDPCVWRYLGRRGVLPGLAWGGPCASAVVWWGVLVPQGVSTSSTRTVSFPFSGVQCQHVCCCCGE
jgi:hypothetical protein